MLGELVNYLLEGLIGSTNIVYFIALLFVTEFFKQFMYRDPRVKRYWFKFDKRPRFPFKMKYFVLILGIILSFPFYFIYIDDVNLNQKQVILQLAMTYVITTSFYELFFAAIVNKFRELLGVVSKAEIKPLKIDLKPDFENNWNNHFYGDLSNINGNDEPDDEIIE